MAQHFVWAASDTAVASISAATTAATAATTAESENELISLALVEDLIFSFTYRQPYLINSW